MNTPETYLKSLAGLRLIVINLLIGSLVIVAVMVFSASRMNNPIAPGPVPMFAFLGIGIAGFLLNLFVMPGIAKSLAVGNLEANTAYKRYSTMVFVRAASAEGFIVLSAVGHLLTGDPLVLIPAIGNAVILGSLLPTRAKLQAFADPVPQEPQV